MNHSEIMDPWTSSNDPIDMEDDDDVLPLLVLPNRKPVAVLMATHPVDLKDSAGKTSLMYAAECGSINVKALLEEKAAIDAKDNNNRTALMHAAINGYSDTVKTLIAEKASINTRDVDIKTSLIHAVCDGHSDVVRILVAAKAIVEDRKSVV